MQLPKRLCIMVMARRRRCTNCPLLMPRTMRPCLTATAIHRTIASKPLHNCWRLNVRRFWKRGRPQGSPPLHSATPALTMNEPEKPIRNHCKGGGGVEWSGDPCGRPRSSPVISCYSWALRPGEIARSWGLVSCRKTRRSCSISCRSSAISSRCSCS